MEWPRIQLGLIGDRGRPEQFRIELAVRPAENGDELVCLHDPVRVGTFARVFAGQIRQGGFTLPLALKVQRDAALSAEAAQSVAAKFDCERLAYRRLDHEASVALHHDFAAPDEPHALRLPPAIVCRHAAHALEPLCPQCGGALAERPAAAHEERTLVCGVCDLNFACKEPVKEQLIRRAVRRDPACDGCEQSEAECRRAAQFLNFFPARLLAFERLDLDLADFFDELDAPARRNRHPRFWASYQPPDLTDGAARLSELLGVFRAIVAGVGRLHAAGVTHFDLKPNNICLRADAGRLVVRLIDLGFADVPEESLAYLRQVQGERRVESDYAAPELERPTVPPLKAQLEARSDGVWACIQPVPLGARSAFDPLVQPGDRLQLAVPNQSTAWSGGVDRIALTSNQLDLRLSGPNLPAALVKSALEVRIRRYAGPAADLFSLGVMLLELLTGEANLAGLRTELSGLLETFLAAPPPGPLTPGALAEAFARLPAAKTSFGPLHARLKERFGPARGVAEELFGVALRLVCRGSREPLAGYVASRSAETVSAVARLSADLATVERLLTTDRVRLQAENDREQLRQTSAQLRQTLAQAVPSATAPPATTTVPFHDRQLRHALGLAGDRNHASASLRRLLGMYRNDAALLHRHLQMFEGINGTAPGPSAASVPVGIPEFDYEPLVEVLRLGATRDANRGTLPTLRNVTRNIDRLLQRKGVRDEECRRALEAWIGEARLVAAAAEDFDTAYQHLRGLAERIHNMFAQRLIDEQARESARDLEFRLGAGLRKLLGEIAAIEALNRLRTLYDQAPTTLSILRQRWKQGLATWETRVPRSVRVPLQSQAEYARRRETELVEECEIWQQAVNEVWRNLRDYVADVGDRIAHVWDHASRPGWFGPPKRVVLRFGADFAEWYLRAKPLEALDRMAELSLGPAIAVHAHLLIDRCRTIHQLGKSE